MESKRQNPYSKVSIKNVQEEASLYLVGRMHPQRTGKSSIYQTDTIDSLCNVHEWPCKKAAEPLSWEILGLPLHQLLSNANIQSDFN